MIENIALTELIDKYLGGELKPEEKAAFEKRLATETALSEQVTLHRQITASFKSSGRASLLAMLEEEDAKMPAYQEVAEEENHLDDTHYEREKFTDGYSEDFKDDENRDDRFTDVDLPTGVKSNCSEP